MLFSSLEFLILFLPAALGGYYLLPKKCGCRNYWLFAASVLFYAWGEPTFVLVMLGSIAFNYLVALGIDGFRSRQKVAHLFLWGGISGNICILGAWKYANFITGVLRDWMPWCHGVIPQTSILLPIGISFFTFQATSYIIDVYRGIVNVQRNPFCLGLYIALFPQLVAGPIVRYSTVCEQIEGRKESWSGFVDGTYRFLVGFNKKMLLANLLSVASDTSFVFKSECCAMAWLGAVSYTLQIYFDFSGYSDMAIGLGKMFGFQFQENFNYPYVSKSISEFWRRWHISLGSWFRDYVYFPLGGSRVGRLRLVFNLAIVWLLTGIWHGASWNFILWGVAYGILIMFEKLVGIQRWIDASKSFSAMWRLFTMSAVVLGWVLFRSPDLSSAVCHVKAMFGMTCGGLYDASALYELGELKVIMPVAIIVALPLGGRMACAVGAKCAMLGQMLLFLVSFSFLVINAHNPFIYFNF